MPQRLNNFVNDTNKWVNEQFDLLDADGNDMLSRIEL